MIKDFSKPIGIVIIIICIFSLTLIHNKKTKDAFMDRDGDRFFVKESLDNSPVVDLAYETAVIRQDEAINAELFPECYFVLLVNNDNGEVYATKNATKRMYPASLTKLMTALVVCDKMDSEGRSYDEIVTVNNTYDLSAEGGGVSPLGVGSKISVKNLLAGLLVSSNNYYGLILADYIAGSEAAFCQLMNEKALSLGATNTHFANPHGLDNVNHYSSAYDMYLIIRECYKYPMINELDEFSTYSYTYKNPMGYNIEMNVSATNWFLGNDLSLPANYKIHNWKTGTTDGAGNCLAMLVEDTSKTKDNHYVVISSCGESKSLLYDSIIKLLCLIK